MVARVWSGDGRGWEPFTDYKGESDSSSYTVVRLNDPQRPYGLMDESEDYTGHGCQCGSSTAVYGSLRELLNMGVPEQEARDAIVAAAAIPGRLANEPRIGP